MSITKERIGELAMIGLHAKKEADGVTLKPKEVRRQIINEAKDIGVPANELAEFAKIIIKTAYDKVIAELDIIISKGYK